MNESNSAASPRSAPGRTTFSSADAAGPSADAVRPSADAASASADTPVPSAAPVRDLDATEKTPHIPNARLCNQRLRGRSRRLGVQSREYRRRFLATLPELDRRGLVAETYGSIFTYAAMVGGAQKREVLGALSLARRLARFPRAWQLFETGEVGRAVLMRVPVTLLEEDEASWVRHLKTLSKAQIEDLVAEEQARRRGSLEATRDGISPGGAVDAAARTASQSGFAVAGGLPGQPSATTVAAQPGRPGATAVAALPGQPGATVAAALPGQPGPTAVAARPGRTEAAGTARRGGHRVTVFLSDEEYTRLLIARKERSKEARRPVSMSETLREAFRENFLDSRPPGVDAADHAERAALAKRSDTAAKKATGPRIPVPVRRFVRVRSAGRCERPGCGRPGEHVHHQIKARTRRRRLPPRLRRLPRHHHDALVHLCHGCHGLVHEGLIENPFGPPASWRLRKAQAPPVRDEDDRRFGRIRARARRPGKRAVA